MHFELLFSIGGFKLFPSILLSINSPTKIAGRFVAASNEATVKPLS
jgi:hypothetical protein